MKIIPTILLLCLFQQISAQELENSLLWKVSHPEAKEESYLFGTYHLVGSTYLDSNKAVADAFNNSSVLVVETVIDSSRLPQLAGMMVMADTSLEQLVDSAEYELLRKKIEPVVGMGLEAFHHMKPMVLSNLYALLLATKETPDSLNYLGNPLEIYMMTMARKNRKDIVSLETMEEQMELLYYSTSVQQQADELVEMVREIEAASDLTAALIIAYHEEDLNEMWKEAEAIEGSALTNDLLLKDRNIKWMEKLEKVLEDGNAFIAVGALHLPGENGVIKLLRERGYKVEPVLSNL